MAYPQYLTDPPELFIAHVQMLGFGWKIPPIPTPLDAAIADPEVSIYEVIRLAEESVGP